MNVGELIDLLSQHDRDTLVVRGTYQGFEDINEVFLDFITDDTDRSFNAIIID